MDIDDIIGAIPGIIQDSQKSLPRLLADEMLDALKRARERIAELQAQIDEVNEQISAKEAELAVFDEQISAKQSQISELQSQMQDCKKDEEG